MEANPRRRSPSGGWVPLISTDDGGDPADRIVAGVASLPCLADAREHLSAYVAAASWSAALSPACARGRAPLPSSSAAGREPLLAGPPPTIQELRRTR